MLFRSLVFLIFFVPAQALASVVVQWGLSNDSRTLGYKLEVRASNSSIVKEYDTGHLAFKTFPDLEQGVSFTFRVKAYGSGSLDSEWTSSATHEVVSGSNPNIDTDNDGLTDQEELSMNLNPLNPDSDADGVFDGQEITDGTDPLDRGSQISQIGNISCVEWNGYLGNMGNIVEHTNLGNTDLTVTLELLDKRGRARSDVTFLLAPGNQQDIIVNQLEGFTENEIGQVCSTHNGQPGDLDGRMLYYRAHDGEKIKKQNFDFAVAMPFVPGTLGKAYVPFNTFQPSLSILDIANPVMNWVQITNLEDTPQDGIVTLYDASGEVLFSDEIKLNGRERRDFTPNLIGKRAYGLVEWLPDNNDARFQIRNVRYIYDNQRLENSFYTAFQHEAVAPSGRKLVASYDARESSIILEISNAQPRTTDVQVEFFDSEGTLVGSFYLALEAKASYHLIADSFVAGTTGSVVVNGVGRETVIANVMHYQHWEDGHVKRMYGLITKETNRSVLAGSYNTFIGHDSEVILSNNSAESLNVTMLVKGSPTSITLPAHGTTTLDPDNSEAPNRYGVVKLVAEREGALRATLFRKAGDDYTVPVEMR